MSNPEERLKILQLIEEQKITAAQGAALLSTSDEPALEPAGAAPISESLPENGTQWFRVLVTDTVTGKIKTRVSIPLRLVDWGLKVGSQYTLQVPGVDLQELGEILHSGSPQGKIIDVMDEEDGEHVEIFVE